MREMRKAAGYIRVSTDEQVERGNTAKAQIHLTRAAEIFESLGTSRYLQWTKEALANFG